MLCGGWCIVAHSLGKVQHGVFVEGIWREMRLFGEIFNKMV
jgi:hypothetical protein